MESNALQITWPSVNATYEVPEGLIDLDVHEAAGKVLRRVAGFAMSMVKDEGLVVEFMYTAAAKVTAARSNSPESIKSLTNYLYCTYKNLLCDYWKKQNRCQQLSGDLIDTFVVLFTPGDALVDFDSARELERKRLVAEIVEQMDGWTLEIFDLLVIGYTFEDIARKKGEQSNRIRATYNRRLKVLAQKMLRKRRP